MIKDIPDMKKMKPFAYDFENRTMIVFMKQESDGFSITKIIDVEKKPGRIITRLKVVFNTWLYC